MCALGQKSLLCEGAPPPAGTLQSVFFLFCLGSANFLLPLSRGSEPLLHRSARAPGLAAAVAAPRALAQSYLVNTARSFDNFLLHWSLEIPSICVKKKELHFLWFTNSDTLIWCRTYQNQCLFLISTHWVIYLNKQQARFLKSSASPRPPPNSHESFVNTDTWGKRGKGLVKEQIQMTSGQGQRCGGWLWEQRKTRPTLNKTIKKKSLTFFGLAGNTLCWNAFYPQPLCTWKTIKHKNPTTIFPSK